MFTGLHVIEAQVLNHIPADVPYYSIIDTYLDLLRAGEKLYAYETLDYWNDLGQFDRYKEVDHALKTGTLKLGHITLGKGEQ